MGDGWCVGLGGYRGGWSISSSSYVSVLFWDFWVLKANAVEIFTDLMMSAEGAMSRFGRNIDAFRAATGWEDLSMVFFCLQFTCNERALTPSQRLLRHAVGHHLEDLRLLRCEGV